MTNLPQEPQGTLSASAPGTAGYNPAWFGAADIYWDPQAGSDAADGLTALTPVQTPAEIYRRYGAVPTLLASQTIHQLSSDTGTTRYSFAFVAGAPGVIMKVLGTPANKGAAFAAGAVTAISRANPGNDMLVAGFPGGTAVGDLVLNVTLNTYAWVDAIAAGTATLTPPFDATGNAGVVWVAGNSLQLLTCPNSNIDVGQCTGGAATPAGQPGVAYFDLLTITDSSGVPGDSVFTLRAIGASAQAIRCNVQSFAVLDASANPGFFASYINCFLGSGGQIIGSGDAGTDGANAQVTGGRLGATGFDSLISGARIRTDCIVRGTLNARGFNNVAAHILNTLALEAGRTKVFGTTGVWGAGTINVLGPSAFTLASGIGTFANFVKMAALQINGAGTASTYTGLGVNADAVAITSATIDAQAAMFNVKTGGRFAVTSD